MKNIIHRFIVFVILLSSIQCAVDNRTLFGDDIRHQLWLTHEGADMAITVEGNNLKKRFCILVHGGPGSSAQEFNTFTKPFSDVIERDYAMVYYDQRAAGISRGTVDPETETVAQHVDDLDQIIELLYLRYGEDISIALMGHSWGGYLTSAYLLDADRSAKVGVWVNIDGGIHRTNFLNDDMTRIMEIAEDQASQGIFPFEWNNLKAQAQQQLNSNVTKYTYETQDTPFRIVSNAEQLINKSGVLETITGSTFDAIFFDNYQPYIAAANDSRSGEIIQNDMFEFDSTVEALLPGVELPTLSIYGYWDVRTALQQGEYVFNTIATPEESKELIILEDSGHSPMVNEPTRLANTIVDWLDIHLP